MDIYVAAETRVMMELMVGPGGGCGCGDKDDFVLGETKEKHRAGEERKKK